MSTRILLKGRTVWASRGTRPDRVAGDARAPVPVKHVDEARLIVRPDWAPIDPGSPESPFRAGEPYTDPDEGITYCVVKHIRIQDGWGTADFWMRRWDCPHKDLVGLVERGWLDAAIEEGTETKRYRCRDEIKALAWLEDRAAARAARPRVTLKPKAKRSRSAR